MLPPSGGRVRFACPSCEAVFESGPARPAPVRVDCPSCGQPMEREADVHRIPTRPYDLAAILRQERAAAPPNEQIWFVGVEGRIVGPLTSSGLEGLLARGQLHKGSLVWRDGWPAWTPAEGIPELRDILGLPPPGAPGEPPVLPEGPP